MVKKRCMESIVNSQKQDGLNGDFTIAVVIPCYKVVTHIIDVIERIGAEVNIIYCIDDKCPESSGNYIQENCIDKRVKVLYNESNLGVGGATMRGYRVALDNGAEIIIKLDGDGQMDPGLIPRFIKPIILGRSDYTKGNRFFRLDSLQNMPAIRVLGNAALSFITKLSTGYWNIFDPTNGFTAIHAHALKELPLEKISVRYFFESDMLFRLNTVGAVVEEIPMVALYGHEKSNMKIGRLIPEFFLKNIGNFGKRIFYNYFLRNFGVASVELVLGLILLIFGFSFGILRWYGSIASGIPVSAGTVMLAGLPIIVGLQMLLSFINYDITNLPINPLQKRL